MRRNRASLNINNLVLASLRKVEIDLIHRVQLFREQGSESGALGLVNRGVLAPVAHVVLVVLSHAACHAGHEPRVTVMGLILSLKMRTRGTGKVVLQVVTGHVEATRWRLRAQDIVEDAALVFRNFLV